MSSVSGAALTERWAFRKGDVRLGARLVLASAEYGEDAVVARELEAVAAPGGTEAAEHELTARADQRPSVLGGPENQTVMTGAVVRSPLGGSDRESCGSTSEGAHLS
jgi:hypothetical protein